MKIFFIILKRERDGGKGFWGEEYLKKTLFSYQSKEWGRKMRKKSVYKHVLHVLQLP